MINNIVLTGYFIEFENDNLLLKIDSCENHQIVKILINKLIRKEIKKRFKVNDLIGIKGYIRIDNNNDNKAIIIATNISFLSNK
mgnify:CR=1 FL=1